MCDDAAPNISNIPSIPDGVHSPWLPRVPLAAGSEQGCKTLRALGWRLHPRSICPVFTAVPGEAPQQPQTISPVMMRGPHASPGLLQPLPIPAELLGEAEPCLSFGEFPAGSPAWKSEREMEPCCCEELPGILQHPRGFYTRILWSCGRAAGFSWL